MSKDLGKSTSYAYYVAEGGTKTPQEYGEMLVNIDTVATRAEDAADSAAESATGALNSKNAAQTAATTATNKATEATTAATTATTKAGEASTSASAATSAKDTAVSAASTATTKASEATTAAATATSAKTDAVAANTAAQSAKTAAQTAQTGAETAAASVQSSAAQIQTNADDISELKEDLTQFEADIESDIKQISDTNVMFRTSEHVVRGTTVYVYENIFETTDIVAGDIIHLKIDEITGSTATYPCTIQAFDGNGNKIGENNATTVSNINMLLTVPNNTAKIRIQLYPAAGVVLPTGSATYKGIVVYKGSEIQYSYKDSVKYNRLERVEEFLNQETTNNLFDGAFENASINTSTGVLSKRSQTTEYVAEEAYIEVDASTNYTVKVNPKAENLKFGLYIFEYTSSKTFISYQSKTTRGIHTFKTSATTAFVRFQIYVYNTSTSLLFPKFFGIYKGFVFGELAHNSILDIFRTKYGNKEKKLFVNSRNLFYDDFYNASMSTSGVYSDLNDNNHEYASSPIFVPVEELTKYNVTFERKDFTYNVYVHEYDSDGEQLRQTTFTCYIGTTGFEFTTGDDTVYLRFHIYSSNSSTFAELKPVNFRLYRGGLSHPFVDSDSISLKMIDTNLLMDVDAEAVLPDYYFEENYIDSKVAFIKSKINACASNGDIFYFITDEHWASNAQNSPALIRYLSESINIPRLFSGGDMGEVGDYRFAKRIKKAYNGDIFYIMGNHDYRSDTNVLYQNYDIDNNCQIGNPSRHYYYVDNVQQKIRYIVLSGYDTGETTGFESDQLTWLTNIALDVESGWTIIVFTHVTYFINYETNALSRDIPQTYLDALDAYDGDGTIACIISGHTHRDRITETTGGIPIVITTCDKYYPYYLPNTELSDINVTRELGTITEQAFDVVILDKTNKKITFVRIGAPALNGVDGNAGTAVEYREVTY